MITGVEVVTGLSSHPRLRSCLHARPSLTGAQCAPRADDAAGRAGQERGQQRCRAPEADTASRPHKKLSAAAHIPTSILLTRCCCAG